jgi:hypothetical protein
VSQTKSTVRFFFVSQSERKPLAHTRARTRTRPPHATTPQHARACGRHDRARGQAPQLVARARRDGVAPSRGRRSGGKAVGFRLLSVAIGYCQLLSFTVGYYRLCAGSSGTAVRRLSSGALSGGRGGDWAVIRSLACSLTDSLAHSHTLAHTRTRSLTHPLTQPRPGAHMQWRHQHSGCTRRGRCRCKDRTGPGTRPHPGTSRPDLLWRHHGDHPGERGGGMGGSAPAYTAVAWLLRGCCARPDRARV